MFFKILFASFRLIVDIFFPSRSLTPEISVSKIIFSAFKEAAIEQAAKSPFIFIGSFLEVHPMGEMTGILPAFNDAIIFFLSILFTEPTSPRFFFLSLIALIGESFFPIGKKDSPIKAIKDRKKNLGEVGSVKSIDKKKIMASLKAGKIPVISPIGWTSKNEPMNINGDFAACSIAASLKAEKIILLTDISGVRDLEGKKISTMSLKEAKRILKNKKNIKGGMYPKLTGAIECLEKGVKSAHIVDGRVPHSVLIELLTDKGVGTWISE